MKSALLFTLFFGLFVSLSKLKYFYTIIIPKIIIWNVQVLEYDAKHVVLVVLEDIILHVIVTMTMENLSIATKVLINVGITK